jgi:hypothetical protein
MRSFFFVPDYFDAGMLKKMIFLGNTQEIVLRSRSAKIRICRNHADVLGCAAALPPELGSRPVQEACQRHKCLKLHDISALQKACQRHFKRLGMVYACANAREVFFFLE